jgi:HAMP domain-containing protein
MVKNKRKPSGLGIREKIILSLVVFVALSVVLSTIISVWSFNSVGDIGTEISSDSLEEQAENHLRSMTWAIASEIDLTLFHVQGSVEALAEAASLIWADSEVFPAVNSYNHRNPPPGAYETTYAGLTRKISFDHSCYKLPADQYEPGDVMPFNVSINNSAKLDPMFRDLKEQNERFNWIYMGMADGAHRSYPWHRIGDSDSVSNFDPRTRDWFIDAKDARDDTVWGTPYIDVNPPHPLVITISKAVYVGADFVGVVAVDMTIDDVEATVLGIDFLEGYAFLIDSVETTVIHPDLEVVGTDIRELEGGSTAFSSMLGKMCSGEIGVERVDDGVSDRFYAYAPIESTGYFLGVRVSTTKVLEHANDLRDDFEERSSRSTMTYLMIGVVVIAISIIASFALGNTVVKPIKKLTDIASKVGSGEIRIEDVEENLAYVSDSSSGTERSDEIGALTNSFGDMLRSIKQDMGTKRECQQSMNITIREGVLPPSPE